MLEDRINKELNEMRSALADHTLYRTLKSVDDIKTFMEAHVFAVWDFMSLLKALQRDLTCTDIPWMPKRDASIARFINEIVFGEESDVNELGEPKSHFEMYYEAMQQIGASTKGIDTFLNALEVGASIKDALQLPNVPSYASSFVLHTFDVIHSGDVHRVASAFTFGREDLIPDMFIQILEHSKYNKGTNQYSKLLYYLQRHIDIDGDEHGPLALKMIDSLSDGDQIKESEIIETAKASLLKRIELWDGITTMIKNNQLHTNVIEA